MKKVKTKKPSKNKSFNTERLDYEDKLRGVIKDLKTELPKKLNELGLGPIDVHIITPHK